MNTERLYAVASELINDFSETGLTIKLQQLEHILTQNIQRDDTSDPNIKIEEICESLNNSSTHSFSPTWLEIVGDIDGNAFLARNINTELKLIAQRPVSHNVKLQEIKNMQERVIPYITSLGLLCSSMRELGIRKAVMEAGECEVGIVVPREAVENTLGNFGKELVQLNRILGVFSEITTSSRENFTIKTISSSELTVFVEIGAAVAISLAIAIERILAIYKNMLEIQKLQLELVEKKVPKSVIQEMKKHSGSIVEDGLTELVDELLTKYLDSSNGSRKNELKIELKSALKKLAKRIDEGYMLDIRIEPYIGSEDIDNNNDVQQQEVEAILTATKNIVYPELGDNRVLNLPDIEE